MKTKLQLKTKVKTTQSLRLKRVLLISSITTAFGIFSFIIFLWFNNLVPTIDSSANTNSLFSNYNYNKTITIEANNNQTENILDHPLFLKFKDDDLKNAEFGGLILDKNANDIAFFNQSLNTKLNQKIKSYNPETGELEIWVLVDTLFAQKSTNLKMHFGNSELNILNNDHVWNSNYVGVWELDNDYLDLSYSKNNGKSDNQLDFKKGIKNKSVQFEENTSHITIKKDKSLDLTTEGTLSAWIYLEDYQNYGGIIHKGDKKNWTDEAYMLQLWNNQKILFAINDENTQQKLYSSKINKKTWYYVVATWNSQGMKLYLNGTLDAEFNKSIVVRKTTGNLHIGAQLEQNFSSSLKNLPFKGLIDEVQILNKSLSADNIFATYNNIANFDSYVKIGQTSKNNNTNPVELINFIGKIENKNVIISWQTVTEQNNDYFQVEKSYNGDIYLKFAKISSKGNSTQLQSYSAFDNDLSSEKCYYRIKQVDFDGKYEYFGPISVQKTKSNSLGEIEVENVYPNPFSDLINIDLVSENLENIELVFLDMFGRLVLIQKVQILSGFNNIHLTEKINKFVNGTYILNVNCNNKTLKSIKLTKYN